MLLEASTLVFIDIETGGPNPSRHPIIQIAAVALDGSRLATLETSEIKIRFDERKANKYSLRKNSYSRSLWQREAMPEHKAARQFAAFLRRHATHRAVSQAGREYGLAQLVAHNAAFDGPFLQSWYERLNLFCPARGQVFCTLQRCYWYFMENPHLTPPKNFRLGTLCQYFEVPLAAADAHDALGDVRATVALYRALIARQARMAYSKVA